ncbi:Protein of unknown function DUF58 [Caloramator quimbayensis]|uniref:Uncharacterized protein n=1 Tax=Caloramator quimbayensis TaxID=1147123 RepID=A0A1T4WUZ8_9CLOT|nr:DUF58 domain-containing protein [Caloramator quimbayensis]SKA81124.1 Protein of unknown function DUF58 [Caloramator quimbayensis]
MIYAVILLIFIGIILNYLSKKYSYYKLNYKREISKKIVEIDEEFDITVIIENKKMLPVTFINVTEKFPDSIYYKYNANLLKTANYLYHKSSYTLMPYQRIKRTYKAACSKRGKHIFFDVTLTIGDFLGIDTSNISIEFSQYIIAIPKPLNIDEHLKPYGDYYGDISVKRWIIDDPVLTIGIREYTPYDPQKFIHWPSSLKSNKLMVKKFDYTCENTSLIILNIECDKPFWINIDETKIEKCLSFTRTIVGEFQMAGIPYAYIDNIQGSDFSNKNDSISFGYGITLLNQILENLGRASYAVDEEFEVTLKKVLKCSFNYSTTIIITPFIHENYIEYINKLSALSSRCILITMDDKNLSKIDDKVLIFTERSDKNE